MASVEAAVNTVSRPGLIPRMWHWRYELGLTAGVVLGAIGIGITVGLGWLIATTAMSAWWSTTAAATSWCSR